jgi:hypothetical protein
VTHAEDQDDTPTPPSPSANPVELLEAHLGGPPSPWAVALFWISVAVLVVAVALALTTLLL